jgi:hypothetical protein
MPSHIIESEISGGGFAPPEVAAVRPTATGLTAPGGPAQYPTRWP